MALRPDRDYDLAYDIIHSWDITETVAQEMGGVAAVKTAPIPSGHVMGGYVPGTVASGTSFLHAGVSNQNNVAYLTDPSGAVPIGVLMQDIDVPSNVNRYFRNVQKNVALPGEKVTLVRRGWLVTNKIVPGDAPKAGDPAYLAASGLISVTQATGAPQVGKFETTLDADKFARVYIDL